LITTTNIAKTTMPPWNNSQFREIAADLGGEHVNPTET